MKENQWNLIKECKCDNNLQLWGTKDGVKGIFGTEGVAKSRNGKTDGEGEIIPDYKSDKKLGKLKGKISPNYYLRTDEILGIKSNAKLPEPSLKNDSSIIAVIDTKVNDNKLFIGGYDFIEDTNQTIVSNQDGLTHSSLVSYLIQRNSINPFLIMPLVVLNEKNNGTLFDLLCALEYIKIHNKTNPTKKINFVNMSLGYYGYPNDILTSKIDTLNTLGVSLITAAGNESDSSDCNFADERNMNTRILKFYPASYSRDFSNIYSVTTSIELDYKENSFYLIDSTQNFSSTYVNAAVEGDSMGFFNFKRLMTDPTIEREKYMLKGSSFASPLFTSFLFNQRKLFNYDVTNIQYSEMSTLVKQNFRLIKKK